MNRGALGLMLLAVLLPAQQLAGQQPQQRTTGDTTAHAMNMNMQKHMQMMDSANARLDSLVRRMNQATGNAKVAAMAQVINELVAERRAMHEHMREMMKSHGRMMDGNGTMRNESQPVPATPLRPDTTKADTGHAGHHPT
jgi:hypothetical protein